MSDSEFSLESYETWRSLSATHNLTDGVNLRELVLEGIDHSTKNAIIEFLRGYNLDVTGVDSDTYTVDLTKWDRTKSEQFVELLKTLGGKLPETLVKDDEEAPDNEIMETDTVISAVTSNTTSVEGKIFEERKNKKESDIPQMERRFPIQPHPPEELDFEYLKDIKPFPIQTSPIYQKEELLNIKPMLVTEDTQSTMGSANIGIRKINKSYFSIKCLVNRLLFPFRFLKRLKLYRSLRKFFFKTKSKKENMRKEKAFAIYSTLLEEGPRFGREFRASLQKEKRKWRTVATNTWPRPSGDAWSINSEASKINRGINAVCQMVEVGVSTQIGLPLEEGPQLRHIPKVFSDPEEEQIIWCPCQFITSSCLYKYISKCLSYICDWEDSSTELIKQDIASQKVELREVRSMLMGALEMLEKARNTNNE